MSFFFFQLENDWQNIHVKLQHLIYGFQYNRHHAVCVCVVVKKTQMFTYILW